MPKRRIQLIAGTTYSVSLPKEWVKKNNLNQKDEISLHERSDGNILISAKEAKSKELKEISLNIDEYSSNIDQILFSLYYMGVENITISTENSFSKQLRAKIRRALSHMSATEVTYEDEKRMKIKALLDSSKVDIRQTIYRTSLLIEASISSLSENSHFEEINVNEMEIDRLFHLAAKVIQISLVDTRTLHSSGIVNAALVPSFFLVSKRLENMGDEIYQISKSHGKKAVYDLNALGTFSIFVSEIRRAIKHFMQSKCVVFEKMSPESSKKTESMISRIKDDALQSRIKSAFRYLSDVEDEIVNISFYTMLASKDII